MNRDTLKIVCLCLLVVAALSMFSQKPAQHVSATRPIVASSMLLVGGEHGVEGPPTVTAKFIDQILCSSGSPACGTGQSLYSLGVRSGINPAYALAFFKHESSYGRYGVAASNRGLGNIRCTQGYACLHGFRAYSSWSEGYADWYALIRWYSSALHKSTVEGIVPTYAPSGDNNDVTAYIQSVVASVDGWNGGQA